MTETKATAGIENDTEDETDLWEGIPAALLESGYSYDLDTTGGCG